MTNISSYYHNLKLGPVGMLEVGEPCDGIASSWESWISVTSGPDGQTASLPLYVTHKYSTSVKLCNQAVRLWKSLHWPQLRWLDWIFWGWYLPSLSINYVGMSKDMGKRLPQLYYIIKMKISYDLGFIAIEVAMAT